MAISRNPLLESDDAERDRLFDQLLSADAVIEDNVLFNVARLMVANGKRYPERRCMLFAGNLHCTFGEMLACASDIYAMLKRNGVEAEDTLLATVKPGLVFYASVIAIWTIGAVLIVIDKGTFKSMTKVNHCVRLAKPKAWLRIGDEYWYAKWIFSSIREIPTVIRLPTGIRGAFLPSSEHRLLSTDDVTASRNALVTFTSGSTGLPKMIVREHSFLMKQVLSVSASGYSLAQDGDRVHALGESFPRYHDLSHLTNLPIGAILCLVLGMPCVLETDIMGSDVDEILRHCHAATSESRDGKYGRCQCTSSPAFVDRIVRHCNATGRDAPFFYGYLGGAPVYSRLLRLLQNNMPLSCIAYGSTEAEPISGIFIKERAERELAASKSPSHLGGHCVGRPHFLGGLAVIKCFEGTIPDDVLLEDLQLECGQAGEVVLHGWPVNMKDVPRKRLLFDREGGKWLRMDDGAYLDKDGYVWLVGRMAWRVERDGKTFWSIVVEEKILDQCSLITYATYLRHDGKAYLFIEAPTGLPDTEVASVKELIRREQIPVDEFRIMAKIPRDARHESKPNTGALFSKRPAWRSPLFWLLLLLVVVVLLYAVRVSMR